MAVGRVRSKRRVEWMTLREVVRNEPSVSPLTGDDDDDDDDDDNGGVKFHSPALPEPGGSNRHNVSRCQNTRSYIPSRESPPSFPPSSSSSRTALSTARPSCAL